MIAELLTQVGALGYDYRGQRTQPIFTSLRGIANELAAIVPSHYLIPISEGVGGLPVALWVSILDPEVTRTPTQGTYVVFLFNEERTRVCLSLNQGVTAASERAHQQRLKAKELLAREAQTIRSLLDAEEINGLETELDLGKSRLPTLYAAGNICARTWSLNEPPSDEEIHAEVRRFINLYAEAVQAKELAVLKGRASLPPRDPSVAPDTRQREFKPKSHADYRAHIAAAEQVRTRTHEALVRRLGEWAMVRGFTPNTNVHPRDLMLHRDIGIDCLVELKVFPTGRPKEGLRECIGQLFEYRHFYTTDDTALVAALSEHPGDAYLELLSSLSIAVVWPHGPHDWRGTDQAVDLGLVD